MPRRLLRHMAARAASPTYGRYLVASLLSLALDIGLFLVLIQLGLSPMAAAALGYGAGLAVHWLLSTRFVFDDGMVSGGAERRRQKTLFVATGLIGLCITAAIVGAADALGPDPRMARIFAIAISFQATYLARRAAIFRA